MGEDRHTEREGIIYLMTVRGTPQLQRETHEWNKIRKKMQIIKNNEPQTVKYVLLGQLGMGMDR